MRFTTAAIVSLLFRSANVAAFSVQQPQSPTVCSKHSSLAALHRTRNSSSRLGMLQQRDASSSSSVPTATASAAATTSLQAVAVEDAAAATTTEATIQEFSPAAEAAPSWQDDGFVFGLQGSGLERPKGKQAITVVEGDSLETQPYQVAIVSATFLAHAGFAGMAFTELLEQNGGNVFYTAAQSVLLVVTSWILADFGSGVLHWSVDNYGNGKTPVMGGIIAAFQGHHTAPWTITERGFCNNVYKLCTPFGVVPMSIISFLTGPATTLFFTTFCVFEILSQEFHKWSHQLKSESPKVANVLQNAGLTIARKPHALHHMAPFEGNYCIISGICNTAMDESGFFRRMERLVYNINGVEPNAWKLDPELRARTLAGDYSLPRSS